MRSSAVLVRTFHERGLRVTPQRERLFRLLQEDGRHPTIESLYAGARREMPTISLKTVYQTVYALAKLGEVQILDLGTGSHRVELTVARSHHHLVCSDCGTVRDLFVDFPGLELSTAQREGFRISTAEVIFRGLCQECAGRRQGAIG